MNAAPPAAPMPSLARLIRAACSSATGSQMFMPSPAGSSMPSRRSASVTSAAPAGVLVAGLADRRDRGRIGEQVEQQLLQQAAGPALAEQAPFEDRVEHGGRAADRGQAQVRAV